MKMLGTVSILISVLFLVIGIYYFLQKENISEKKEVKQTLLEQSLVNETLEHKYFRLYKEWRAANDAANAEQTPLKQKADRLFREYLDVQDQLEARTNNTENVK